MEKNKPPDLGNFHSQAKGLFQQNVFCENKIEVMQNWSYCNIYMDKILKAMHW